MISKNANVATGAEGLADAREVVAGVAAALGCAPGDVLVASTGVIGRHYPMDRVRAGSGRRRRAHCRAPTPTPVAARDHDHRHGRQGGRGDGRRRRASRRRRQGRRDDRAEHGDADHVLLTDADVAADDARRRSSGG